MSILYGLKKPPKSVKELIRAFLEQGPEDIADELIKEKFFSSKEEIFSLMALLVQHDRFKIYDIPHFLTFLRSCTPEEKAKLFEIISSCLASQPELKWRLDLERLFPDSWGQANSYPEKAQEIKGVWLKDKIVPDVVYAQLFDEQGCFKEGKKNGKALPGRSMVNYYPEDNPIIYFKKDPELPGYEYAATDFMRRMGIEAIPFSELTMFYDASTKKQYPVVLSQAIGGDLVSDIWHNNELFKDLDPYHTGLSIIAAMLINTEDGKEDNFVLSTDGKKLIPIDNDHAFVPGTVWQKEESFFSLGAWKVQGTVQTKNLLFCLDMMDKPIPDSVRTKFLNVDPDTFLEEWLQQLVVVNDKYQHFFPDFKEFYPQTIMRVPLSKEYIAQVHWKMHFIQKLLKRDCNLTYLNILESIEPYIAKSYKLALRDETKKTLKKRFLSVTQGYYKGITSSGNRLSAANSRDMMEIINVPEEDLISMASKMQTGPDSALHTLEKVKRKRSEDETRGKEILGGTQELDNSIDCTTLSNQEQLNHLTQILVGSKVIAGIALHNCTALKPELFGVRPEFQELGRSLQFLDLRNALNLNEKAFKTIYETCFNLEYLNISGWKELKYLCHDDEVRKKGFLGREFDSTLSLPKVPLLPTLKRLVVNDCRLLKQMCLCLPEVSIVEANQNPELALLKISNYAKTLMNISVEDCLKLSSKLVHDLIQVNVHVKSLKSKGSPLDKDLHYQNLIGELYYGALNYEEALKWYQKAAYQGHIIAQYNIGVFYHKGLGVTQDYKKAMEWYKKAANQGYADAQNAIGYFYHRGLGVALNYEEAMKWYRKAADQDCAVAQYHIGVLYSKGLGVPQDYKEVLKWYHKAANQDYAHAQYALGILYSQGVGVVQDHKESIKWYYKAVDQRHAGAQGECYFHGWRSVAKDYEEAMHWYLKAAEKEDAHAQFRIGDLYRNGYGVAQNYEEAMNWYFKAAHQGYAVAQYSIGYLYHNGYGVANDHEEAMNWYLKAAEQGHARAQFCVALFYDYGNSRIKSNRKEAMSWYLKAAEQGDVVAQCRIGEFYYSGLGVAKNDKEAVRWYIKAANNNFANAQCHMGSLYQAGEGVDQDYVQALKWYQKAAEKGHVEACCKIGILYESGRGIPQDYLKALEWYQKAADKGNAAAQYKLGTLYQNSFWTLVKSYKNGVGFHVTAEDWCKRANQDCSSVQYYTRYTGENGCWIVVKNHKEDYEEARKWLLLAASRDMLMRSIV